MTHVEIYTDGACRGNPGPGGWAALLIAGKQRKEVSGAETLTTNNRMELMGAIGGLGALKRRCAVKLYTDSKYVMQGYTEWLPGWKARGWRTAAREPVIKPDRAWCASRWVRPCRSSRASIARLPRFSRSALARSIPAKRSRDGGAD